MIQRGLKNVTAGTEPMEIKKGIEKAADKVVSALRELSQDVSTKEEIADVGTISAQDEEIGELIAEVMDEVGKDGVITVEESKAFGMEKSLLRGCSLTKVTLLLTWSLMRREWKLSLMIPTL